MKDKFKEQFWPLYFWSKLRNRQRKKEHLSRLRSHRENSVRTTDQSWIIIASTLIALASTLASAYAAYQTRQQAVYARRSLTAANKNESFTKLLGKFRSYCDSFGEGDIWRFFDDVPLGREQYGKSSTRSIAISPPRSRTKYVNIYARVEITRRELLSNFDDFYVWLDTDEINTLDRNGFLSSLNANNSALLNTNGMPEGTIQVRFAERYFYCKANYEVIANWYRDTEIKAVWHDVDRGFLHMRPTVFLDEESIIDIVDKHKLAALTLYALMPTYFPDWTKMPSAD